ncbi:hypothetical protein BZG11_06190 [Salinivibrio kushneri]|nr:hypothetical protein BZG10_15295 [Salinivibrio kushneri]OOE51812.1 hypothetical protein BZG11_06190 [Salinivibrio kushneri]
MASDEYREIYRALRESQSKYTYFLLAAAGASIGFSLNQTQGLALTWSHLPLGIAILCWGVSFFCGCRHLEYVSSTLYSNAAMLQIEAGRHSSVGSHPEMVQAASEGIRQAINSNVSKASSLGQIQFRALIVGACFYIGWHVIEMGLRAPV